MADGSPQSQPAIDADGPPLPLPLLESKLTSPSARRGIVSRGSLVERLRASGDASVITITAPAGFGKTTLLGQWVDADERPFAWISIDDRDNDPTVLLTHLAVALDRIGPLDPSIFDALGRPGPPSWSAIALGIGNDLATRPPRLIVLDDADRLRDRNVIDALTTLLEQVPAGSQIVVAGRGETGLPLARLRVEGRLEEFGPAQLRLNDHEAHELLTKAGLAVSEADATILNGHAEGWPAGLYLASLSGLADPGDPHLVATLRGDDRNIADYLRLEIFDRLESAEIDFLIRTSELDRMCGPLCDAVLGRDDSARVLELLERSNIFVIPLDNRREWYRYHEFFRDLLRAELRRRDPTSLSDLNARAMDWFLANGMPEEAIDHGLAAGRTDSAIGLLENLTFPLYLTGRLATVKKWLHRFGDETTLRQHAVLAILGAWIWLLTGDPVRGDAWADLGEGGTYSHPLPDGGTSTVPWLATLGAWMCRNGVEAMQTDADLAIAELAPQSPWLPTAFGAVGGARLLVGDNEGADRALADAAGAASELSDPEGAATAFGLRSVLAMERGAWASAADFARRGRVLARDGQLEGYCTCAIVHVASARVALHEQDHEEALRYAALAHSLRPLLSAGLPWFSVKVLNELTHVHIRLGDVSGARAVHAEAAEILRHRPELGVLVDEVEALDQRMAAITGPVDRWAFSLTAAELELLPLLATYLTFKEIAARRYVTSNTIKTQAMSVYRKLGASSRSEAVERAAELGLIDPVAGLSRKIPRSG